jgi:hypothetical protein
MCPHIMEHLQEAGQDSYDFWRRFDQADTVEKISQLIVDLKEAWDEVREGFHSTHLRPDEQ